MNEKFEQDQALEALHNAAKSVRAPKLDESILENATKQAAKPSLLERLGMNRKLAGFSLAGAAASVAVVAMVLGGTANPQTTFTLEMGAANSSGALNDAVGGFSQKRADQAGASVAVDYVADDELEGNAGSGAIYEFVTYTTPKDLSESLKRVLGISGAFRVETYDVTIANAKSKLTHFILQDNDTYAFIGDTSGGLYFNYSNANAWLIGDCIREESSPETPDVTYCVENAPVKADLPTDSQAIERALEVFKGLGFETTAAEITVNRGPDSLYAFAPIKVDGKSTGLSWDIAWANSGEISSVNGYAVRAVKVADVSTISAKDTVKRMNDYRWSASGSAELYQFDSEAGVSSGIFSPGVAGTPRVIIVKAKATQGLIYDANGKMYSVPSFAMYAENDTYPLVYVSVIDGVIKLPEPIDWANKDLIDPDIKVDTSK